MESAGCRTDIAVGRVADTQLDGEMTIGRGNSYNCFDDIGCVIYILCNPEDVVGGDRRYRQGLAMGTGGRREEEPAQEVVVAHVECRCCCACSIVVQSLFNRCSIVVLSLF